MKSQVKEEVVVFDVLSLDEIRELLIDSNNINNFDYEIMCEQYQRRRAIRDMYLDFAEELDAIKTA